MAECVPSLFVCLFVPALFQEAFKVIYVPVISILEWLKMRLRDGQDIYNQELCI